MVATLTAPHALGWASDLDLGPLLVAEIEAYLRSLPTPAAKAPTLAPVPPVNPYGQTVHTWHHGIARPEPTLLDRIRGRRPVAEVTPAQHLDLVSRYIHQHGWTQGQLWTPAGAVCILGAQIRILAAGYSSPAVVERARELIGNQLGYQREGQPIDCWNDAAGRTVGQVHQMLRAAAARAR